MSIQRLHQQDRGLRLLPAELSDGPVRGAIQKLQERVARYSKLGSNGVMTLHAETLVQAARENPERRVEVGVIENYHGQRGTANSSIEHYYRITLAAAVYERYGSGESSPYSLDRVIQQSEELAEVTRGGVRDIDPVDAWFTVTRNAAIHLSEKIANDLTKQQPETESVWRQGVVQGNLSVAWDGAPPPPGAPVQWRRPSGEVRSDTGESLGKFERLMEPSQGFLNVRNLQGEKLEPADSLRYQASAVLPVVGITLEPGTPEPNWMFDQDWQLRLAADSLSRTLGIRLVPLEHSAIRQVERILILNVSELKADVRPDGALFSGQWRLRLIDGAAGTNATPSFKTGVQTDTRALRQSGTSALNPPDLADWTLRYFAESLKKLADTASTNGAMAAITAVKSARGTSN